MALDILELCKIVDNLKHLPRTGWVKSGIAEKEVETVACHMYRMAVLAMALDKQIEGLDVMRCVRMCLVHDIGESIVGDITPHCGVSNEEKFRLENEAMEKIASFVPSSVGNDWLELWREYEAAETQTAIVVKHLDKFDMVQQAYDYEIKHKVCLQQFFDSTAKCFTIEPFITWNSDLRKKRDARGDVSTQTK